MCGISGFVGRGSVDDIKKISSKLIHRGPEDSGFYHDPNHNLFFAHQRLIILDKEGSKQPMQDVDGNIIVTFNGEIYNFLELQEILINDGYNFKSTNSDTEVLIHGYKKWHTDLPKFLNGMFAFVIYDKKKQELFIARDRFGEKPLYYFFDGQNFAFASELKALIEYPLVKTQIKNIALQKYFAYGYIPAPLTIYENCYKLKPGDIAVFKINNKEFKTRSYWRFEINHDIQYHNRSENDLIEELDDLLKKAVEIRLRSDVDLGIFLSGGIDSSAILAYGSQILGQQKIKTFSVGFNDDSFDESNYAKKVAKFFDVPNNCQVLDFETAKNLFPEILAKIDEPFCDPSIIATYFLNKFAKKEVKVALNGDGGDELFAGYDTFGALRIAELYNKLTPKFLHKKISCLANLLPNSTSNMSFDFKLKKALAGLNYNQNLWHPTWLSTLNLEQIKDLFNANVKEEELYSEAIELWNRNQDLNLIDKSSEFYVNFYLPGNILPKSDQASMLNSIESRAVFLDKEIAEFSMRLPSHFKLKNNCKKYILKKLLQKKLPQEIINRKKKGFGVPISKWLTDFPKTMPLNQAFFEIYGQAPQINQNVAVKLWHQHQNKQKDHRLFMWSWMILQGFLEK